MYVKITNGAVDQYPYTIGLLRRDNPNTSFPRNISSSTLESWGVYSVVVEDQPSFDIKTQNLTQNSTPTLSGDTWTLGWTVSSKSADEITDYNNNMSIVNRSKRDTRIAETDWWASSDLTMTAEQTAYRQALRDITTHANWPHLEDADWPTKP
jgi:hypothetical protein